MFEADINLHVAAFNAYAHVSAPSEAEGWKSLRRVFIFHAAEGMNVDVLETDVN